MKVGVLQFFSWPERRIPLEEVYERAFDRIRIMDQTGYDAVWLAEHHFSSFSICPSIHMMGTHIARITDNLRIGTAVSLAPFYHPLRLAEEVALLDVLSDGRVNWGAGRGYQKVEFEAFGVAADESYPRFRENVQIVLAAWTNDRIDFDGEFWQFHDIEVLPKPRQRPHPPVWLAASSAEAITWAGAQGFSIMLDPHSSHVKIGEKRSFYAAELAKAGYSPEGREVPMARLLAVAPTREKAEEIARAGATWTVMSHRKPQLSSVEVKSELNEKHFAQPKIAFGDTSGGDPIERYLDDVIIYGTPDEVGDEIERLREEIGLEYLLCAPLSHSSFLLFTEQVLPRILG
ncbi:MAG: LLM class flavin-dependent oxidoreductase [Thermoanaerobaculia bacterium]|nr:LLM class flavin-dependent oxidoreductase [Thermoanaerobaculia bacterium]